MDKEANKLLIIAMEILLCLFFAFSVIVIVMFTWTEGSCRDEVRGSEITSISQSCMRCSHPSHHGETHVDGNMVTLICTCPNPPKSTP